MLDLGNQGFGIWISSATNTTIGGTLPGAGNVIAFNGGAGIRANGAGEGGLTAEATTTVRRNSISSNGGIGIDMGPSGVTLNDPGDTDGILNFPVLALAVNTGSSTVVHGTLNSTAITNFDIEFSPVLPAIRRGLVKVRRFSVRLRLPPMQAATPPSR